MKFSLSIELDNGTMPDIADYLEAVATGLRNAKKSQPKTITCPRCTAQIVNAEYSCPVCGKITGGSYYEI